MSAPPLTHHEILGLVEPLTRRDRHVDLAASDRVGRKLVFKPIDLGGESPDAPRLREILQLECRPGGSFVLTRVLTHPSGLQATLQTSGSDLANLLAQIEAADPQQQFRVGPGFTISCSYEIGPHTGVPNGGRLSPAALILTRGVAQLDGLTLSLNVLAVRGVAGDFTLEPAPGSSLDLPEDLLAVLGWDWARLAQGESGWSSKIRLRGDSSRRSRTAEAALDKAARHVARVLAEPPVRFHRQHYWARWGVVLRRSIPTLTAVFLIVGALLLPQLTDEDLSGIWLALHYVPIAILAMSFSLQEMARFEIPRFPMRPRLASWRHGAAAAAVSQTQGS